VVLTEESSDVSRAIKSMSKELFRAPQEDKAKKRRLMPALSRA
jgi:hypothetical protein